MKTRVFACQFEDCFKSFRDEDSLVNHQKIHDHSKNDESGTFICSKCNRVLATKQSLKEHSFTHTRRKPFRCSEIGCGKMFRQSSQLCNHRKVHKEAKKMLKKQEEKDVVVNLFTKNLNNPFTQPSTYFQLNDENKVILPLLSPPCLETSNNN